MSKKGVGLVVGFAVLALLIAGSVFAWFKFGPKPTEGSKTITVQMVYDDVDKTVTLKTDEQYLRGALEAQQLLKGEESQYGLFVKEVDGRVADDLKQEWWCLTKGGEMVMTGVDMTPIADGDKFELTLKVGYEDF